MQVGSGSNFQCIMYYIVSYTIQLPKESVQLQVGICQSLAVPPCVKAAFPPPLACCQLSASKCCSNCAGNSNCAYYLWFSDGSCYFCKGGSANGAFTSSANVPTQTAVGVVGSTPALLGKCIPYVYDLPPNTATLHPPASNNLTAFNKGNACFKQACAALPPFLASPSITAKIIYPGGPVLYSVFDVRCSSVCHTTVRFRRMQGGLTATTMEDYGTMIVQSTVGPVSSLKVP